MGSWLYIPGNNVKALKKVDELSAHKLILDLEDAVPVHEKSIARDHILNTLKGSKRKSLVRINDVNSGLWKDDLSAVFHRNLEGIVLPKAESKEDIAAAADYIHAEEQKHQLETGSVKIYPLIESAKGVLNAQEIASAHNRVVRLLFGAVDYSVDVNATLTTNGNELLYARTHLVLVSKAAHLLAPIDTVFINIEDSENYNEECYRVKELGFGGKMVIHPKQLQTANTVFLPSAEEIEQAKEIIEVFTKNEFNTIKYKGLMIDKPVYTRALNILNESQIG